MRRVSSTRLLPGILFLVLATLSTGLPSHYHGDGLDDRIEIAAADRHDHGVILTEQASRLRSVVAVLTFPVRAVELRVSPIVAVPEARPLDHALPRDRPPPSASPRAPPLPS